MKKREQQPLPKPPDRSLPADACAICGKLGADARFEGKPVHSSCYYDAVGDDSDRFPRDDH